MLRYIKLIFKTSFLHIDCSISGSWFEPFKIQDPLITSLFCVLTRPLHSSLMWKASMEWYPTRRNVVFQDVGCGSVFSRTKFVILESQLELLSNPK